MRSHCLVLLVTFAGTLIGCGEPTIQAEPPVNASQDTTDEANRQFQAGESPSADATSQASARSARQPSASPTDQAGIDWPSFLGPSRNSKSPEKGIDTQWPETGPPIVWQRELGEGYGIGSVADGRYFQFDRIEEGARLVALDASTGESLWEFIYPTAYSDLYGYDSGPRASPVIDGERVYIYGVGGRLHCLNVNDGKLLWKLNLQQKFGVVQNFFGVGSTPIIEGDLLLVMVGGSPPESQELPPGALDRVVPNESGIVALDKLTGEVKYTACDDLASYAAPVVTTINDRRYALAFLRSGLWAFEPATGKIDFHYDWRARSLESVNASTPVVVDDKVFISETYGPGSSLLQVQPDGHEVLWRDDPSQREKSMQTHWNTAVHVDGYLYGSSGRHEYNAELRCIELETGKVMWSELGLSRSSLLWVDDHFVCLSEDGTLRLLKANPRKYDPVAEVVLRDATAEPSSVGLPPPRLLKAPAWAAPILSHGLLYVRGKDRLVCLELIPGSDSE